MTRAEKSSQPALLDRMRLRHKAEIEASKMRAHPASPQTGSRSPTTAARPKKPVRRTMATRDHVDFEQRVLRATELTVIEFAQAWRLGLFVDDPDEEIQRIGAVLDAAGRPA